jgi:ubiquinone/menaquinone biosynthesis C-methylase UbiE
MTSAIPGFFQGTEMPNSGWWEALWPDPAAVLSATGIKPGMEVIDLCCGDGWFTLPIARVARHVVAIDIDADLLEAAKHRLAESGATNCDFVAGDAYELARLAPRPADFIFMANAFHGVPDRPRWRARCGRHSVRAAVSPSSTGTSARAKQRSSRASPADRGPN